MSTSTTPPVFSTRPPFRKLRCFAFDPVTSLDLETAEINQMTHQVPWEDDLKPGPEGEYIKVIDHDPASNATYKPIDLNDPSILASDGLPPSETNPQFHQQMTYAVIMTTIKNFEKALGRKVMWSPQEKIVNKKFSYEFVEKLYVYPHALRDQNAYYSPERKALLFGYYNATPKNAGIYLPGGMVYSCLSHDILAHETTHALLDGMYSRFMENTNPDVGGFHEGFSDLVALLQHFTHRDIVRNQVRKVRGELDTENLLAKMAVEFGQSTGEYRSLRDAIGISDHKGRWRRNKASTRDYDTMLECHDRGALLVSAVFDAFLAIYESRTADLVNIASAGTGILVPGEIHPDLVNRLADEASKVAAHVLNMCVRALDYCPPLDLNYGDYLRALITADKELVENDEHNYRIAFINAFRKRGIFPEGVPNLSVETLCYQDLQDHADKQSFSKETFGFLRGFKEKLAYVTDRETIFTETKSFIQGDPEKKIAGFHSYLFDAAGKAVNPVNLENITGLIFSSQYARLGIRTSASYRRGPSIEIHSLRIHNRTGPDGNVQNQIIMTLAQRTKVHVKEDQEGNLHFIPIKRASENMDTMTFRGGCTLIFDLNDLTLKHAIAKPIFDSCHIKEKGNRTLTLNKKRLKMQYRCTYGDLVDKINFAARRHPNAEPFSFIHKAKTDII